MALSTPKRIKVGSHFVEHEVDPDSSAWSSFYQLNGGSSSNGGDLGGSTSLTGGSSLNITSPSTSSCGSPEFSGKRPPMHFSNPEFSGGREHRRGRPRSESLTTLMIQGSTSPSSIKCKFCSRVFPREKSLAAHLRTHTGERPYTCDYPGCTRAFTQSGQLKTHQRLHTGERPFICSVANCEMRFTHANRHCPVHVHSQLKRDDNFVVTMTPEQDAEVLKWLEKYRSEREDRNATPTRKTPQRPSGNFQSGSKNGGSSDAASKENHKPQENDENDEMTENENGQSGGLKRQNDENECPLTPNNQYKSRKGLMVELDMNAGLAFSPVASLKMKPQPKVIQWQEPLSQEEDSDEEQENDRVRVQIRNSPTKANCSFYPKKKWLRDACLDDLAKPLDHPITSRVIGSPRKVLSPKKLSSPQKLQIKNMNQMRPTVLMLANNKEKTAGASNPVVSSTTMQENQPPPVHKPEEQNRKWLGAMALMQLAAEEDPSSRLYILYPCEGETATPSPEYTEL